MAFCTTFARLAIRSRPTGRDILSYHFCAFHLCRKRCRSSSRHYFVPRLRNSSFSEHYHLCATYLHGGARHYFVSCLRISSLSQTLQIIQSTLFCITFAQLIVCQTLPLLRNSSHLRESGDIILYHVCATHLHERGDIILYHVCARASLASMHS